MFLSVGVMGGVEQGRAKRKAVGEYEEEAVRCGAA